MPCNRWCDRGHDPVGWYTLDGDNNCWFCGGLYTQVSKPSTSVPREIRDPDEIPTRSNRGDLLPVDEDVDLAVSIGAP